MQVSVLKEELNRRCRELENCRLESSRQLQEQQLQLEQTTSALNKELDALRTELQFKVSWMLRVDNMTYCFGSQLPIIVSAACVIDRGCWSRHCATHNRSARICHVIRDGGVWCDVPSRSYRPSPIHVLRCRVPLHP